MAATAAAFGALIGCTESAFFCSEDAACNSDGGPGFCESNGLCSFPDAACESGRRYGEYAPAPLANTCTVPEAPGTTTASSPTNPSTGEETTGTHDGTPPPQPSTTTPSSTEDAESGNGGMPPLPTCGDGDLDPGETCDDGNAEPGDGCSAWCDTRGETLDLQINDDAAIERCSDLLVVANGLVLTGWRRDTVDVGFVERHDAAGGVVWSEAPNGATPSRLQALTIGPNSGDVYVGGSSTVGGITRVISQRHAGSDGALVWSDTSFGGIGEAFDVALDARESAFYYSGYVENGGNELAFLNIKATGDGETFFSDGYSAMQYAGVRWNGVVPLDPSSALTVGRATTTGGEEVGLAGVVDTTTGTVESVPLTGNGGPFTAMLSVVPERGASTFVGVGRRASDGAQPMPWAGRIEAAPLSIDPPLTEGSSERGSYVAVAFAGNGDLLVAGHRTDSTVDRPLVRRLDPDTGAVRWSWMLPDDASGHAYALALGPEGVVVACGDAEQGAGTDVWIARIGV